MLITPWFAVGVGFVIAGLLVLPTPHQTLSFGPPVFRRCSHVHCAASAPGSAAPGLNARAARPAGPRRIGWRPATTARASFTGRETTVRFQLLRLDRSGFFAFLTVPASARGGWSQQDRWSLRFTLPGTHGDRVWGARWRGSAAGDGGLATGRPWPWPRSGADAIRISMAGTGAPGAPSSCVFDGAACTFARLPGPGAADQGRGLGRGQGKGEGRGRGRGNGRGRGRGKGEGRAN